MLTVLAVNFWLLRYAADQILAQTRAVLMPFQIIGKEDESGKLGLTLAQMLIARVGRIEQEMETSAQALKSAQSIAPRPPTTQVMNVNMDRPITFPEQIFEPIELKLSLGGVEVGSFLSWFQKLFSEDRGFRVSIEFTHDKRAIIAGIPPGDHQSPMHLEVNSTENYEVIAAFAYSIMQRQMSLRVPEVSALSVNEFETLLSTLNDAADINTQFLLGAQVKNSYAVLLPKLAPLLEKMPRWVALLNVAAQIAESSENDQIALEYYQRELAQLQLDDPWRKEIEDHIGNVQGRLVAKTKAPIAAPATTTSAATLAEKDEVLLQELLASPVTTKVHGLVGVKSLEMPKEVVIAVAGGFPRLDSLPEGSYTIIGVEPGEARSEPMMEDYVDSLVQWVRVIAPKAKFVFAPITTKSESFGSFTDLNLRTTLETLAQAKPQIILWTFGPMQGEVWVQAMVRIADSGILLVTAAGNDAGVPIPFDGTDLMNRMVVASAVDLAGQRAVFSQQSAQTLWAPGVELPIQVPGEATFSLRSGTAYSAAISAGVAARLYAEKAFPSPAEIVTLLRDTASPAEGQSEPKIINLANGLQVLATPEPSLP